MERVFVAGGSGFIGSHFVERFLSMPDVKRVTVYDNLSSGRLSYLDSVISDGRLNLIEGNIHNQDLLVESMRGHDAVVHLASNPDIAKSAVQPSVDFFEGTYLTHLILEAMRLTKTLWLLYASGSGIYGELGEKEAAEDYGPLMPISTYGASKLAGETLICAYAHMFDIYALAFRFGNVVGPRQTHGVAFDFLKKLESDSSRLEILGDGNQSKSYVHVSDIINAVLLAQQKSKSHFDTYNVATGDYITVKEIAEIVIEKAMGSRASQVKLQFTGGDRGWKGDVPIVRLNTAKIKSLGWQCKLNSKQAVSAAVESMIGTSVMQQQPSP